MTRRTPPAPTRRLVLLGAAGTLAGCGFHPLYATADGGTPGPAAAALAAVYVPVLPERTGQLIRQALQQRFEGAGTGIAKKYQLDVTYNVANEGIAIQRDTSTSRIRLIGSANWVLRRLALDQTPLASGSARVLDGFNILNQQYFAADLESGAATARVAQALADQITQKVGIYFQQRAATPA